MSTSINYRINRIRLLLGFVVGAEVPVIILIFMFPILWKAIFIFGSAIAMLATVIFIFPIYCYFKNNSHVNIWIAILTGAIFLPTIYMIFMLRKMLPNTSYTFIVRDENVDLIVANKYTMAGILFYFIKVPLLLLMSGALGGLVGWLVAIGFRFRPLINQQTNDGRAR